MVCLRPGVSGIVSLNRELILVEANKKVSSGSYYVPYL